MLLAVWLHSASPAPWGMLCVKGLPSSNKPEDNGSCGARTPRPQGGEETEGHALGQREALHMLGPKRQVHLAQLLGTRREQLVLGLGGAAWASRPLTKSAWALLPIDTPLEGIPRSWKQPLQS